MFLLYVHVCESPWISKEAHDMALNFFKVPEKSLNFPQSYLWLSIPDFFWISARRPFHRQGNKQLHVHICTYMDNFHTHVHELFHVMTLLAALFVRNYAPKVGF